jgi:hypothetical protein
MQNSNARLAQTRQVKKFMFSENVGKSLHHSGKKIKPFNQASGINILVAGGGIRTTCFVRDFMPGPGSMLERGTRIDSWRYSFLLRFITCERSVVT